MDTEIFPDYQTLSERAADVILHQVRSKPDAMLCLAAGDTPRLTYARLVQLAATEAVDFSKCRFVALDEWIGIPPENEGSCAFFLHKHLFAPLAISPGQSHLFDALSSDLDRECKKMDRAIQQAGGIDLMLVGVGMNGHIGFNEPGARTDSDAYVVTLDETTRRVGQKYFTQETALQYGITLGLKQFLESRMAVLIASGSKKADVMKRVLEDPISTSTPASIIRKHPRGVVMLDRDAASTLQ